MMNKKKLQIPILKGFDILTIVLCMLLSAIGIVLFFGILETGYGNLLGFSRKNIFVQGVSFIIGLVCAIIMSFIGYENLAKMWRFHVPLCYILLLLTFLVGKGTSERSDDKRWLIIPGINLSIQPAELLRISFILFFAFHIYSVYEQINDIKYLLGLLGHGAVPVVLLHFQGDDGSALIFAVIMVSMLFAAGLSLKYVVSAVFLLILSLPIIWKFILNDFQKQRILALYNPTQADIQGFLFQQDRALTAIGSGQLRGTGLFSNSHVYVPEMHNDFVFSFLGQSFGFIGCIVVIAIMLVLWFRILYVANRANDVLGQIICIGVFAGLSFQSIINVGMNISILPVIGNTLPFLSYGGSSMVTSFLSIGLVLSVYSHSSKSIFSSK